MILVCELCRLNRKPSLAENYTISVLDYVHSLYSRIRLTDFFVVKDLLRYFLTQILVCITFPPSSCLLLVGRKDVLASEGLILAVIKTSKSLLQVRDYFKEMGNQ